MPDFTRSERRESMTGRYLSNDRSVPEIKVLLYKSRL
ncbi:hypothetical protein LINGRAHAP2_LOCUS684 [Linum grandiflorum]